MGEARRRKLAMLASPAVRYASTPGRGVAQIEGFRARYTEHCFPVGESIEFAPVPTWGEMLGPEGLMMREIERIEA